MHHTVLSSISVVLQQVDHVSESVAELRGAAHLSQHAEEVRVRDALPADVSEQVRVRRLTQDDLCVVCVEVDLGGRGGGTGKDLEQKASNKCRQRGDGPEMTQTCRVPLLKSITRAWSVFTHCRSRGGGPEAWSSQGRSPP